MKKEDYTKYLSIDNGHGILLSKSDAYILNMYHINYCNCSSLKELIFLIEECLDECYDVELENVLMNLTEVHYYHETNK